MFVDSQKPAAALPKPRSCSLVTKGLPPTQEAAKGANVQAGSEQLVQFFESEEFLLKSVAEYIVRAVIGDGRALVIATSAHLSGVANELMLRGLQLPQLKQDGRYVALNANEALAMFMIDGLPDPDLFERHIGSRIASMTAGGQRLSAFGEMVSLLWSQGKKEGAMQLEALWSALTERHTFTLFCAYPLAEFASTSATASFQHLCAGRTRVLPSEAFAGAQLTADERSREIATLQQQAAALETEVSERKKVEESLRLRETELSAFVETAPFGLHWVDREGIVLWANAAELELLGYGSSEVVGRHIADFHVDSQVIREMLEQLFKGEKVVNREAQIRCRDGTVKTVLIDSSPLVVDGRFIHSQCFMRDITAQRSSQHASLHLAAIVEGSDDAIFSKTLDGVIMSWNAGAQRIFGYTADEVIGQSITILIPPERLGEEPEILAKLRRGERVDHFETVRRRKDGTLLDISVTISPIRDEHGIIIGASKIARDVTAQKRAERELDAARKRLAEANEELERRVEERTKSLREAVAQMEEFSYMVSHDLRAPLRGMQNYSHSLLEDYGDKLDENAHYCLRRIADNARRLDKMVSDVLTLTRVSRVEAQLERVNLDKLVRELIEQFPEMAPPRANVTVDPLHDVMGHEPSLVQIVSNLLSNSVKFVAPGVTPAVHLWSELNADGVRLWIKDNGIGINSANHARLFKMFERVHPDLPYEGTGVGLAIVRKAANRIGGEVGALADCPVGSTFWVQLRAPDASTKQA